MGIKIEGTSPATSWKTSVADAMIRVPHAMASSSGVEALPQRREHEGTGEIVQSAENVIVRVFDENDSLPRRAGVDDGPLCLRPARPSHDEHEIVPIGNPRKGVEDTLKVLVAAEPPPTYRRYGGRAESLLEGAWRLRLPVHEEHLRLHAEQNDIDLVGINSVEPNRVLLGGLRDGNDVLCATEVTRVDVAQPPTKIARTLLGTARD